MEKGLSQNPQGKAGVLGPQRLRRPHLFGDGYISDRKDGWISAMSRMKEWGRILREPGIYRSVSVNGCMYISS